MEGETLQQLIDASGESQRSFGKRIGVSYPVISRYCTGEKPIPDEFAEKAKSILVPLAQERIISINQIVRELLADRDPEPLALTAAGKG